MSILMGLDYNKMLGRTCMKRINKDKYFLGVIILFLVLGWFYWFQWRPINIRKDCLIKAKSKTKTLTKPTFNFLNLIYKDCLVENGLRPEDFYKE